MEIPFFKKKKPEKKKSEIHGAVKFANDLLAQCESNTQKILTKLAHKRDEMLHLIAAEGKEEEIEERFERMADYLTSVDWKAIINQTMTAARNTDANDNWTTEIDTNMVKWLINMQWKIIRVDMNEMIMSAITIVERGEGA